MEPNNVITLSHGDDIRVVPLTSGLLQNALLHNTPSPIYCTPS
jgi:hypothetical protein